MSDGITEACRRERRPRPTIDPARVLRPDRPLLADVLATLVHSPQFAAPTVAADDLRAWCDGNRDSSLRFTDRSVAFVGDALEYPLHRETRDPAAALETLIARGLLPPEALDDAGREFVRECVRCLGGHMAKHSPTPCDRCGGTGALLGAHPPDLRALVAWASLGCTAIANAEETAREAVARLRPWGAPQPRVVAWRVVDAATWTPTASIPAMSAACWGAAPMPRGVVDEADAASRAATDKHPHLATRSTLAQAAAWSVFWRRAVADGRAVALQGDAHDLRHMVRLAEGARFADLRDPFEPILDVWRMGLALYSITPEAVVLAVPETGRWR